MSTTTKNRNNSSDHRGLGKREHLERRTQELLSQEIGFIPNPRFRELDADRAWRRDIANEAQEIADLSSGGSRVALPAHLERMCAAPLLTPEEERDLFCRMNYLKYRANSVRSTLNASRPSAKKVEEIEMLMEKSDQYRNRIVNANTRLVISIVKKFADEKNSFDDLLSEGISCLMKAVEKFDFERGFRFSTYATMAVRREVYRLIKRSHRDRSRFSTGSNEVLTEQVNVDSPPERSEGALLKINSCIAQMIKRLDEREQFIVRARYGFVDVGAKPTFSKLGEKLGVSKERVRQLEMRAMFKLRDLVDDVQFGELAGLA